MYFCEQKLTFEYKHIDKYGQEICLTSDEVIRPFAFTLSKKEGIKLARYYHMYVANNIVGTYLQQGISNFPRKIVGVRTYLSFIPQYKGVVISRGAIVWSSHKTTVV